jgi:aminopeptidase N
MRLIVILLLFSSVVSSAQNLKSGGPLKPEQAIMDIRHYTIALDIDPQQQFIKGYTEIDLILSQSTNVLLFDFWHGLTVTKVEVNGKGKNFQHGNDDLIRVEQVLSVGKIKVKIDYEGKPGVSTNAPWTGGFQWEKDSKGNPWIAITCQGEGGKIFFPCKDHPSDEPNEGADLILTVPNGLVAAGPGLLIKQSTKKDKTTFHWRTNYAISNYCLVFNIGKYKKVSRTYTTVNGNQVPMDYYVTEENENKAAHELEMLERTSHILEKYFGEYPWVKEKIGLCETPHLGMEHQTLIAYGNKYRYTKVGGEDFDWLLNHEFGHEWWANKVTNRDTCGYRKAFAALAMRFMCARWRAKPHISSACKTPPAKRKTNCQLYRARVWIPTRFIRATSTERALFSCIPCVTSWAIVFSSQHLKNWRPILSTPTTTR